MPSQCLILKCQKSVKSLLRRSNASILTRRNESTPCIPTEDFHATEVPPLPVRPKKLISPSAKKSHSLKLATFFGENPHIDTFRTRIPEKYLALKRLTPPENLYLIDNHVAKTAAAYILPGIRENEDQIICETNPGFGFISSELLNSGIKLMRLYESCLDFKTYLREAFECYKGRIELFTKDIFLLPRYEYIDKQDHGNRVQQLLKGLPKRDWSEDPVMTIIGPLSNITFIHFIIKCVVLQNFVSSFGRFQLYTFIKPRDFIVLTAGPHLNLHTYQRRSVLFSLFFDFELLDKFPRKVFLPWQSAKSQKIIRYPSQVDTDLMYFVRINFKKKLPVEIEYLLPLYAFVMQFFGRGTKRIVPALEKWAPGAGLDIMVPKLKHRDYFADINIYTKFGELLPQQILSVFRELITHPEFKKSHFLNIIESQMIKSETIESSLDDHLEKAALDNIDSDSTI